LLFSSSFLYEITIQRTAHPKDTRSMHISYLEEAERQRIAALWDSFE